MESQYKPDITVELAVLKAQLKEINNKVDGLRDDHGKLPDLYVKKEVFAPVQAIVFGLVGTIMLGFIGAVVTLVFKTT